MRLEDRDMMIDANWSQVVVYKEVINQIVGPNNLKPTNLMQIDYID